MFTNDMIIKKVKGLLAIADDTLDDEESQAAFLLAQKLMIKHNVQQKDIDKSIKSKIDDIDAVPVTPFKTLFWWEKQLAGIISKNFRVKNYCARCKRWSGGGFLAKASGDAVESS